MCLRNKIGIALAAAIAAGSLAISVPAQAAVYTIAWTGVITTGSDGTGVFIPPSGDVFAPSDNLSGQAILITVKVDTQTPGTTFELDGNGGIVGLQGIGSAVPITAWITINGVTRPVLKDYDIYTPSPSDIIVKNEPLHVGGGTVEKSVPGADQIQQNIQRTMNVQVFDEAGNQTAYFLNDYLTIDMRGYQSDFADGDFETAPISHVLNEDEKLIPSIGYFQIGDDLYRNPIDGPPSNDYYDFASGTFGLLSFTVTSDETDPSTALPEPGTWAMMIAGFGLAGAAMRGSKRAHARIQFQ